MDDLLDYTGSAKLNKPTLEDLATGVYSLPLLLALDQPELKTKLLPILNKKRQMSVSDMQLIQEILVNSAVIEKSRTLVQEYAQKAVDCLDIFQNNSATTLLKKMPQQLLKRSF